MSDNAYLTKSDDKMDFLTFELPENSLMLSRTNSFLQDGNAMFDSDNFKQSFDSTFFDSQTNLENDYSTPNVDYSITHQCTCNCRQNQMQAHDFATALSRQSSANSRSGFRLHKNASEEDARELFLALAPEGSRQIVENIEKCDTQSRSTEDDNHSEKDLAKLTLVETAIEMVEKHQLNIAKFGDLSEFDKHFLANIIYIKNKTKVDVLLSTEEFVSQINSNMGEVKEKRNDDRLRFVYKRAIKHLLSKTSDYTANKLHKMEDFKDPLIQHYFPKHPDLTKELMDTSFASRKKILKLFKISPLFKRDFMEFAQSDLKPLYKRYAAETYHNMHRHLIIRYQKKECDKTSQGILLKTFKRLPWKCADIQSTVDQIALINLL